MTRRNTIAAKAALAAFAALFALALALPAAPAYAEATKDEPPAATEEEADGDKSESTTPTAATTIAPRELDNPFGEGATLFDLMGRALTLFTSIAGSVALLMFVYGGITWVTSGGSPDKIETGRKSMAYAVIGLVIIFGSYAILRAVFTALGATL